MARKVKETKYYIDKKEFLAEVLKYQDRVKKAEEEGKPLPKQSDRLGIMIMTLCEKVSLHRWFRMYPFRDELRQDAIEDVVKGIVKFDINKTDNAFAYFTQIAWYAIRRRIIKEKKALSTKVNLIEINNSLPEMISTVDGNQDYFTGVKVLQSDSTLEKYSGDMKDKK